MKLTKSRLKQIIKEELEVILTNEEAADLFGDEILEELEPDPDLKEAPDARRKGKDAPELPLKVAKAPPSAAYKRRLAQFKKAADARRKEKDELKEAERTAKGNVTQKTREKHATVGKDKFPIFDKKSAEAAIDLRGHAPEADRAKIINKAARYAPAAAKKAREADKKD